MSKSSLYDEWTDLSIITGMSEREIVLLKEFGLVLEEGSKLSLSTLCSIMKLGAIYGVQNGSIASFVREISEIINNAPEVI